MFSKASAFYQHSVEWATHSYHTDIGVANPNAQGQAIIKTAIALMNP
jgi:hypothetical protein